MSENEKDSDYYSHCRSKLGPGIFATSKTFKHVSRSTSMHDIPRKNDTGPGKPGIDNLHIPGRAYFSNQVEDSGCSLCRSQNSYHEHDGVELWGTEGQSEIYIWLARGYDVPDKGAICEDCLAPLIDNGSLEMVRNRHGARPTDMSAAAVHELFTLGARAKLVEFYEVRDASENGFVDGLSLPITFEEIDEMLDFAELNHDDDPERAGRFYTTVILAFGKEHGDPGFEISATRYLKRIDDLKARILADKDEEMRLYQMLEEATGRVDTA
jgi:hypothetical protein